MKTVPFHIVFITHDAAGDMEMGTLRKAVGEQREAYDGIDDDASEDQASAKPPCSKKGGVVIFVIVCGLALILGSIVWLATTDVSSIYRSSGSNVTVSMEALTSTVMGLSALYIGLLMVFLPPCLRYQISGDAPNNTCCHFRVRSGRLTGLDKIMVLVSAISLVFIISGCVYYSIMLSSGQTLLTDSKQFYACFALLAAGIIFGLCILAARGVECFKVSKESNLNNNEEIEGEDF